jgi:hypothetical protein
MPRETARLAATTTAVQAMIATAGDDRIEAMIAATLESIPPDAALVDALDGRVRKVCMPPWI